MIRRNRADSRYVIGMVSGAHFISHVYLLAYPPLFPLLRAEFGLTTTQLGLIVTAIYVPTLLFQLPVGELVDRVGAKRILAAGIVVTAAGVTLSGLATTYWTLLTFAFLSGIGQSVFHPADYAMLHTVTEQGTEGTAFGAHTFGGFAGFAAAPVLSGGIAIAYGWQVALVAIGSLGFAYAAFLSLTTDAVYAHRIRETRANGGSGDDTADGDGESGSAPEGLSSVFTRGLFFVFAFYLVSMMAIVGLQSFTTVFVVQSLGFSDSAANTVLTAYLTATAVGVLAGGPLADRLYVPGVIVGTFVCSALGVWFAVLNVPGWSFGVVVLAFSTVGLLIGAALPSRDKLANAFAASGNTGKSFGFFFTGLSLGAVISPALLGLLIDARSVDAAFIAIGILLILAPAGVVTTPLFAGATTSGST